MSKKKTSSRHGVVTIRLGRLHITVRDVSKPKRKHPRLTPDSVVHESPTHADDWSSLCWEGIVYTFTPSQRPAIKLLWESWERGASVTAAALVEASESDDDAARPGKLFQRSPAWGTVIRRMPGTRDVYTLWPRKT